VVPREVGRRSTQVQGTTEGGAFSRIHHCTYIQLNVHGPTMEAEEVEES
jgi:hypothetical protein